MGLSKLREIAGENQHRPLSDWNEVAPDMEGYIVEFIAGDILSRPGLDAKSRQLVTVSALAALNTAPKELQMHMSGALNLGWTETEVTEALIQIAIFAGFPASLNALTIAKEVFSERKSIQEPKP
jgi:4-carboxymuconolactone decarboxylase